MLVRTISQLPQISEEYSNGLMEIAVPEGNSVNSTKFTSKSIRQTALAAGISSVVDDKIAHDYHLKDGSTPINVDSIRATVVDLSANDMNTDDKKITGVKRFDDWPYILKTADEFPSNFEKYGGNNLPGDAKYVVPNVDKVNELIGTQPVYFSTDDSYVAEGNPLQSHTTLTEDVSVPDALDYKTTIGSGKFYFWRIDENDSSKSIFDTRSGTTDAYEEMRDTGQLVVWGWLADNGEVSPEMSWVGLFAKVKTSEYDTTLVDVPISIQPWIRGENASILQYLSFNVPVKKGLKLKIKTGFVVNQQTSGAFQNRGTMTFIDRYVPNAFFGYIIK